MDIKDIKVGKQYIMGSGTSKMIVHVDRVYTKTVTCSSWGGRSGDQLISHKGIPASYLTPRQ